MSGLESLANWTVSWNQPTNHTHPPTNQPTHAPSNQPTYQPTNQATNQSTTQLASQPPNPLTRPPSNQQTKQVPRNHVLPRKRSENRPPSVVWQPIQSWVSWCGLVDSCWTFKQNNQHRPDPMHDIPKNQWHRSVKSDEKWSLSVP